jgi:indolepyruvate decarboxylase
VFGGGWGRKVATEGELEEALTKAQSSNQGPALIEIVLDRLDTSDGLKRLGAELSPDKAKHSEPPAADRIVRNP